MIDTVEAYRDADDYGDNRQGIEKCRQERSGETEGQRQQSFATNGQQQAGKDEQQQLFHKVDARHHKNQQQQDFQIGGDLVAHVFGGGHADKYGLDGQQPAGNQRVAFQRHGQREDKLHHQQPSGDKRIDQKDQRVDD